MRDHIEAMMFREKEQRRISDEALIKADVIQRERMELERFLDKQDSRKISHQDMIRKLVGE